jgi:hypothetical protein
MAIFKYAEGFSFSAVAAADLSSSLNLFAKIDSNGKIALCGADEKPAGVIYEAAALGAPCTIYSQYIAKVVASGAIAAGARVASAASGQAKTGTTNPAGIALNATTAAGQLVSVLMCG